MKTSWKLSQPFCEPPSSFLFFITFLEVYVSTFASYSEILVHSSFSWVNLMRPSHPSLWLWFELVIILPLPWLSNCLVHSVLGGRICRRYLGFDSEKGGIVANLVSWLADCKNGTGQRPTEQLCKTNVKQVCQNTTNISYLHNVHKAHTIACYYMLYQYIVCCMSMSQWWINSQRLNLKSFLASKSP